MKSLQVERIYNELNKIPSSYDFVVIRNQFKIPSGDILTGIDVKPWRFLKMRIPGVLDRLELIKEIPPHVDTFLFGMDVIESELFETVYVSGISGQEYGAALKCISDGGTLLWGFSNVLNKIDTIIEECSKHP